MRVWDTGYAFINRQHGRPETCCIIDSRERLVIAIVGAILAVLGLALWGFKDAAAEEIIVRSAVAAAIILCFPVVYAMRFVALPSKVNNAQQKKIAQLEEKRKPLLSLNFENKPPFVNRIKLDDTTDATIYRTGIKNESMTNSIDEVRCVIKQIDQRKHAYTNAKLKPLHGPPAFQLAAGGEHVVSLLLVPDTWESMLILYADQGLNSSIPKQDFKFLIEAQGKNTPSRSKWFAFTVSSDGTTNLREVL